MLENYSMQELKELGGHEVVDANGESVGYVDLVFVDDSTGRPE
jgi:sporulation protein YlmC with PRC-barrel domain